MAFLCGLAIHISKYWLCNIVTFVVVFVREGYLRYNYVSFESLGEDYKMQDYVPDKYQPISMWGYFGYSLLFSIPVVGFILICIFSFGGAKNINKRNFARSYFCSFIICLVIIGVIALITLLTGGFAAISEWIGSLFK